MTLATLFYEKAVVLAIEAEAFSKGFRRVDKDLAIIIMHQAVEMGLKARLVLDGKSIYESNRTDRTISYEKALRTLTCLNAIDKNLLSSLNNLRNSIQHHAILGIPDSEVFVEEFVQDLIFALNKILPTHPKKGTLFSSEMNLEKGMVLQDNDERGAII